MSYLHQDFIRGEVDTDNAAPGVAVSLFKPHSTTAYTLASNEAIVITDFVAVSAAGGNIALTVNTDAAGSRLFKANVATNGGIVVNLSSPMFCPFGVVPKVFAAADVEVSISGFIVKA